MAWSFPMDTPLTLDIPDELAAVAAAEASRTSQSVEAVLLDWLRAGHRDLDSLPDDRLLAVCDLTMPPDRHAELSDLLEQNREGQLNDGSRNRLNELMAEYQRGLLRKAKAMQLAVARGLKLELE